MNTSGRHCRSYQSIKSVIIKQSEIKNKGNHTLYYKGEHLYLNLNVMHLGNTVICNIVFCVVFYKQINASIWLQHLEGLISIIFLLTILFLSNSIWKTETVLHFKLRLYHVWCLSSLFSSMYNLCLREKCNCVNSLQWLSDVFGSEYGNKMWTETNYFDILHITVVSNLYQRRI